MRKRRDSGAAVEVGGAPQRLTPVDVQQQQFRRSFRGYDEQEVDDFLDRVTDELSLLLEERRAIQEGGTFDPAGPSLDAGGAGAGQVAEATRSAEEIKRHAREQAEAAIREAQARAEAILRGAGARVEGSAPGRSEAPAPPGGGGPAVLSAFVSREREFLQRLAQLVQGHAEGVKDMVQAARRNMHQAAPPTEAPPEPVSDLQAEAAAEVPPEPAPPPEAERSDRPPVGGPAVEAAELEPVETVVEPEPVETQVEPEPAGTGVEPEPVETGAEPESAEPVAEPEPEGRWSPPEPPRLPDLPAPPDLPQAASPAPRAAEPPGQPVRVPGRTVEVPKAKEGERGDTVPEAEREATLRELFWGED
jgi:DivIVA domain-containing protein